MKILNVVAENFKGRNFEYPLQEVNLITGPNYSGKSAIMDALKIGLIGYHPRLGKQAGSTMSFAGDLIPKMSISLLLDSKQIITHTWKRSAKGNCAYNAENTIEIPVVLLDTKDYFERTVADRIKFIFDKINPATYGFSDDVLLQMLSKIEKLPIAFCQKGVGLLLALANETIAFRDKTHLTHQGWMELLLDQLRDKQKEFDLNGKNMASKITAFKSRLPAIKPPAKDEEIQNVDAKILALNEKITIVRTNEASWKKNAKRREEIEHFLKSTSGPDPRNAMKKEVADLDSDIRNYVSKTPELDSAFAGERGRYKTLETQHSQTCAELEELDGKLKKLILSPSCPYCKSQNDGWKDALETEYKGRLTALKTSATQVYDAMQLCVKSGNELKAKLEESRNTDAKFKDKARILSQKREELYQINEQFEKIAIARSELDGLNSMNSPDLTGIEQLESERESLKVLKTKLLSEQMVFNDWDRTKKELESIEQSSIEQVTYSEIFKDGRKIILNYQESMVGAAFENLLLKTRPFTDGLLLANLDYRNSELGMTYNESWISHATFSGTEELLAYAGISVALAQESKIKIVMMDELGRMEPANKNKLIQRMKELTATGVIDQFIGIDVSTVDYKELAGVNVITLK